MQYFPAALQELADQFARLPGIGGKTAQRLAFHVLSLPMEDAQALADAILAAKEEIHTCPVCQNLTDKMLAEFLDMDRNLIVNLHIQSLDQMKAIKLVKSKVTDINRMKIEEQKKAVRSGYDMDIIPSDLNTYGGEAKRLLEDLQSRNERMFLVTVLFLNTA